MTEPGMAIPRYGWCPSCNNVAVPYPDGRMTCLRCEWEENLGDLTEAQGEDRVIEAWEIAARMSGQEAAALVGAQNSGGASNYNLPSSAATEAGNDRND